MTNQQRRQLQEYCAWAAKELREASEGFRLDFDENGIEHLDEAMRFITKIAIVRNKAYPTPASTRLR